MDVSALYRQMVRSRLYELEVARLWREGRISGEMHLSTGEEGIAAGIIACLKEGDALSLTYRCSAALVARGLPLVPMLRELLGQDKGLCRGRGGHMHLFSREHLVATSGIVGASLPVGAGLALAARALRPGSIAFAFLGAGAMDQGMALETLNLASAWSLPLVIVCVDNGWAITTPSRSVTAGDLLERATAFAVRSARVDGSDVEKVASAASTLVDLTRRGRGPSFLLATSPRLDGHFLGDPLPLAAKAPLTEGRATLSAIMTSALHAGGARLRARAGSLRNMMAVMNRARRVPERDSAADPLTIARRRLKSSVASRIDAEARAEITAAVAEASHA